MWKKWLARQVKRTLLCLLGFVAVTSCSGGGGEPTTPGIDDLNDIILRAVQWNDEDDHEIQDPYEYTCGHIDVSNIVYAELSFKPTPGPRGIIKIGDDIFKNAVAVVVAWAEKEDAEDKWDVYFRLVIWEEDGGGFDLQMSDRFMVGNSYQSYDHTYPAVTASYKRLQMMPVLKELTVDIAYEKDDGDDKEVWHSRFTGEVEATIEDVEFTEVDTTQIPFPGGIGEQIGRHPDIIFYSFPGYAENDQEECETLFAVYEYEDGFTYRILHYEYDGYDWGELITLRNHLKGGFDPDIRRFWPQYPRIDAGLDFGYDDEEGTSMTSTVWHVLKWKGTQDPYDDPTYFDIDWRYMSVDLSDYPDYDHQPVDCVLLPNDSEWSMFPYIDYDPIEKFFDESFEMSTYAHCVLTKGEGDVGTFEFDEACVMYGCNLNLWGGGMLTAFYEFEALSGLATIAMYAHQGFDDDEADFDLLFISNFDDADFPVYCQAFEFIDGDYDVIEEVGSLVEISDAGNDSAWIEALNELEIFKPVVGAIFDWRNDEGVWVTDDDTPIALGDYELNWVN